MPKSRKSLTKKELEFYKKILLELRAKIVGDLTHLEKDGLGVDADSPGESADPVDAASDSFEREFAIGLATNEQEILNQIDVALRKIEDRSYGICEKYNTPIPKKRLMALPYTKLSKKAQEEAEQERLS